MRGLCQHCGQSHVTPEMYAADLNNIAATEYEFSDSSYLYFIESIDNPFLQHIFYYIGRNYELGGEEFSTCKKSGDAACQYLKKWITLKKDLFTYGGKHTQNETSWYLYFSQLSKKLENIRKYNKWCTFSNQFFTTKTGFPEELNSPNFNKIISQHEIYIPKYDCAHCTTNCNRTETHAMQTSIPVNECSCNTEYTSAMSVGFTLLGTFVTFFLLYKFTNIVSWLYGLQTGKKRENRYIDEEEMYEFPKHSYENNVSHRQNRRNQIFYSLAQNEIS
ncbi:PIR Superfamily Protein [Plasmodium ovale wallikeri]|uniref:PIR Superfamily Protein n=2 Tax=Plasmodium ovale TaxID=36330 RepID=A0A1A9AJ30_PLAOA|nr:PIR Superfamily Protein [Plasmodium ovale wallikeri]SBT58349.1 PIR Superfamily Protein [Plasmodium ovale wallikeri]SBT74570.1 PIR protein [Plasmodium ovale]